MKRILIVEDEPAIALGLEDDLKMEGYRVEVTADGTDACRSARERAFDLVILDIMLPGKDGFDVCRELRRTGQTMPILMLTAKTQESEKVMGLELGADDYLTKPFGARELRARVKALLRRANGIADPELHRFGDVEVNFARGEVKRDGLAVELTPIEFRLLGLFIRITPPTYTWTGATGWLLPNGARLSPDAAWIFKHRIKDLSPAAPNPRS